ncbi:hypothetical protein [Limnobacter parvus]|uniref:Uncharacterized protein n=1 Tax=Limnobacter parvus TaxID=2939690 RepID=A0ABT1XH26_9BURK|nr:hypothetical protein [Limnobacter parvus]MCR2746459.1 hypothetical protein [Limnobacter parvus]
MQTGLWGMQVDYVRAIEAGESTSYELERDCIESVLPLMSNVNEHGSVRTIGGRCSKMADMRYFMVHSFFRPGPKFARIDPRTALADANCDRATEFSQRTLARLLAMQLIGAGYNIKSEIQFDHQDPRSQTLIGTPGGFKGYGLGKALLNGTDTHTKKVEKITAFMQGVREVSRGFLRDHEANQGVEARLGGSDQLAHRARLVLLSASPRRLQANPDIVKPLVTQLNEYERAGIRGYLDAEECAHLSADLITKLQEAKPVLLTE